MELIDETKNKTFEIEKIITCKLYKNKKYYLIKWLILFNKMALLSDF